MSKPDPITRADRLVTVCSECRRACCWQGTFMCDEARFANVIDAPISELEKLDLEHPDYWKETR